MMRHAIFRGGEETVIGTGPVPEPAAGEVLLKVRRTALCGSDNRLWRNGASQIPGHEIFGTVDMPGHPRHGERVCVYIPVYCGHCHSCRAGYTQSCETQSVLIGWNRDGGFAEYVAVPEQCLLPVPDFIEDRLAPLLLDTIGTSAHAVRTVAALQPPERTPRVLVAGAGPVGIGVLIALIDAGYGNVEVHDPNLTRLALAKTLGAADYCDEAGRRYGLIFECSGAHASRNMAITRIAPGGAVALIGENSAPWTIEEGPVFRRKDFHLVRTFYFPIGEHADNVELLRRRHADYSRIVDAEIGIDALPRAYRQFATGELLKPLLTFRDG